MDNDPVPAPIEATTTEHVTLVSLNYSVAGNKVELTFNVWVALAAAIFSLALFSLKWRSVKLFGKAMEVDEAEVGVGTGKIKLRPNMTDRQVAYAIWVELSTRKIGLPVNLDDDVVAEIYDSWYQYFGVTRELIKTVPVSRVSDPSTRRIIQLSIDILNEGLRPHLTKWQARFRRWYEAKLGSALDLAPQEAQAQYPHFAEMSAELRAINDKLIAYRAAMKRLVYD